MLATVRLGLFDFCRVSTGGAIARLSIVRFRDLLESKNTETGLHGCTKFFKITKKVDGRYLS